MTSISVFARAANRERQSAAIKASPPRSSASRAVSRRLLRCDDCSSESPAACLIQSRLLCVSHFVAYCYRRLTEYENALEWRDNPESARRFFRECAVQATRSSLIRQELGNIERARLLDIVLWSNDLFGRSVLNRPSISANGP